jgi:hypothetical protein
VPPVEVLRGPSHRPCSLKRRTGHCRVCPRLQDQGRLIDGPEARIFAREREDHLECSRAGLAKIKDLGCGKRSLDRLERALKGTTFRMATSDSSPSDTLGALLAIEAAALLLTDRETKANLKLPSWPVWPATLPEIDVKRTAQIADEQCAGAGVGTVRK